jgi:lipoyl(octanoyl) transferase
MRETPMFHPPFKGVRTSPLPAARTYATLDGMPTGRLIEVHRPGTVSYTDGLEWQRAAAAAVRGGAAERVAMLEHEPVYTLGARASRESLRRPEGELPAPLVVSSRGGDVTFHGPGQLVAYPVLDLRARGLQAGDYVRALEGAVIAALAGLGVEGERWPGRPGVWVRERGALAKVAAIGVRVAQGVSAHGLALNVSTDLRWFDAIVPCGIEDAGVTSLARVLGAAPALEAASAALIAAFAVVFESRVVEAREPVHA